MYFKIINYSILTVIIILLSITALGACYQKPRIQNDPQGPYIPKNLSPYVPITGGGITVINETNGQPIPVHQTPVDYIDIYTTIDYQNFVYKSGTNLTIPLYLKLISQTRSTANVTIDPHNPNTLFCSQSLGPNMGGILLNDYMHYDYNGTLELKNGTLANVLLTISIPSGMWPYPEPTHIPFNLLGVDSTDFPMFIVPRFSGEIDL
jgi:hypothetical protein